MVNKGVTDVQSVHNPHPKRKSSNKITMETTDIAPQIPLVKRKKIMWKLELSHEYSLGNMHKVCITPALDFPKIVFGANATVSMETKSYKIKHDKKNITKGFYTVAEVTTDRGISGNCVKFSLDYSVHGAANEDIGWRYALMSVGLFVDSEGINCHLYQNAPHAKKASWSAMLLKEKNVPAKVKLHRSAFIIKHGCNLRKFTLLVDQNTK
jgi:hypothetical protein